MESHTTGPIFVRLAALSVNAILLTAGAGCQGVIDATDETGSSVDMISFKDQIQPILNTYCFRCHRSGGEADLAGITLQLGEEVAFDLLVNQSSIQDANLRLVVPGDAQLSLLFLKLDSDTSPVGDRMPLREAPLSAGSIGLIRDWIDQGALNN